VRAHADLLLFTTARAYPDAMMCGRDLGAGRDMGVLGIRRCGTHHPWPQACAPRCMCLTVDMNPMVQREGGRRGGQRQAHFHAWACMGMRQFSRLPRKHKRALPPDCAMCCRVLACPGSCRRGWLAQAWADEL
jgi:hypothetical protein